jgi:hypothetical protein
MNAHGARWRFLGTPRDVAKTATIVGMSLLDGDEKSHRCPRGDSQEGERRDFGWIVEAAMKRGALAIAL